MKIALICGGPSLERGISLNSARSVMDHLGDEDIEIVPIYFDHRRRPYHISQAQLYSNTPSDFDFKLKETAHFLSQTALKNLLKSVDIAFPVMHGAFGEDGGIQRILERYDVPYIGSPVEACRRCFDKHESNTFIGQHGFFTLPSTVLKIYHSDHERIVEDFFKTHRIKRAAVKPATGGSSIGVFSVSTPKEALEKAHLLFSKRMDTRVVIEPFCEGIEFTVILLQNRFGMPVAVLPTEIEIDYTEHQVFDFRKKYLPTRQVKYHCPPRFDAETLERIQVQAEQLFTLLGMRDFARFDGWLLPDGNLWFSDFNPISGMEQNSFLFQQGARVGFSHRELLRFIVQQACRRYGIPMLNPRGLAPYSPRGCASSPRRRDCGSGPRGPHTVPPAALSCFDSDDAEPLRKPVHVLFGGQTSERQVSLMSGTNVWLKLRKSKKYDPVPFLLDMKGDVWKLPYALTLNHTVEEIYEHCLSAQTDEHRLHDLVQKVRLRLALEAGEATEPFFLPQKQSIENWIDSAPFAFLALHGGMGEDGTLQQLLVDKEVPFNGSGPAASKLCMDKYATISALKGMGKEGVFTLPQHSLLTAFLEKMYPRQLEAFWANLVQELKAKTLIVKPQSDGCSSGVVRLTSAQDLARYVEFLTARVVFIPKGVFPNQDGIIEMPLNKPERLVFEPFLQTDVIRIKGNRLKWRRYKGWIEVTVGVLEKKGRYHALSPSLTVAEGSVLSVEEKFQGGTGVNITPPSMQIVSPQALEKVKQRIEKVAERLGIGGYCRIDTFMHVDTGDLTIIEVNTMPGLTPSTVLFHQGLAESKPIYPVELLEGLIEGKGY